MRFDEEGFRADLLAGNWSEWLIDEVVRRLEPYLTPDEDAIVLTKDEAELASLGLGAWKSEYQSSEAGWEDVKALIGKIDKATS